MFLKTKYYPVDADNKIIIKVPFKNLRELTLNLPGTGLIGLKGSWINLHWNTYKKFKILQQEVKSADKK